MSSFFSSGRLSKPFKQIELMAYRTVFNYFLITALRIVEKYFGILAGRFRVFDTNI